MSTSPLHSCFATQIRRLIDLRRLSGTDYRSQVQLLGYFDQFLNEQSLNEPRMTHQITDAYQRTLSRLAPRSRYNRFSVVRQLCQFLAKTDPLSYVPEPLRMIPSGKAHKPYIYSQDEIKAILSAAARLPPPNSLRPHTYQTLFGLLYTTGIRIGEAIALNLQDYYREDKRLYIACGKFHKARWVPLSSSACLAVGHYIEARSCFGPQAQDSPLFINLRQGRLHHCSVNHDFHQILAQCDRVSDNHTKPRIHDLRHTFAVDRLLAWYKDGQDVNARLPALATYMGHVNIASTRVYLQTTAELIEQVDHRFHNYFVSMVKPKGE